MAPSPSPPPSSWCCLLSLIADRAEFRLKTQENCQRSSTQFWCLRNASDSKWFHLALLGSWFLVLSLIMSVWHVSWNRKESPFALECCTHNCHCVYVTKQGPLGVTNHKIRWGAEAQAIPFYSRISLVVPLLLPFPLMKCLESPANYCLAAHACARSSTLSQVEQRYRHRRGRG